MFPIIIKLKSLKTKKKPFEIRFSIMMYVVSEFQVVDVAYKYKVLNSPFNVFNLQFVGKRFDL